MSNNQAYRERERGGGGDREANFRSGYNNRGGGGGGFRGRGGVGGYNKPRRYWDSDDYYKDERDHGGRGRRRRSYSRSRSRSRSYSSRSRSRSRSPTRRGRSRSPPKLDEIPERPMEQSRQIPKPHEPYIPSKEPSWSNSRMQLPQEYMTQTNGQAPLAHHQMNPYGGIDTTAYPPQYQEGQQGIAPISNPATLGYAYGHSTHSANLMSHAQYQPPPQQPPNLMFPHGGGISQPSSVAPPPPTLSDVKSAKDDGSSEGSKKKKDKRKKKKRHHSSSSSSSSSDDSSESRRRRKSKKDQGSSDSSSDEEKKESASSSVLTTAQKDALLKQREGYQTKLEILEREIGKLQNKEDDLIRSRADRQLIDENLNLQAELKGRCKAVIIVLEKIDDVLKVGNKVSSTPAEKPKPMVVPQQEAPVTHQPPKAIMESQSHTSGEIPRKGLFEYVDNGQHWCRLCNVFPETVEQMLTHFHSKEHHDQIQQLGIDEKPWHKRNSVTESKPVSGARKAPFRGMQFFSPVEGWYCRLCNSWMGDPHCAVEHLKSDEHNSNYLNFLEEHPDWEHKWVSDRERALGTSGKQDSAYPAKKSRFDDSRSSKEKPDRKPVVAHQDDLDSGKSIRVQMRNSLKGEERGNVSQFTAAPVNEVHVPKDSGLDEWMSKPKVTVDIIDTQKFAAIVRQKHGTKEKETKEGKSDAPDVKPALAVPPSSQKDKDYKKDDRRRTDKVELQISSREKDRDRYRERDSRGSRRRSRSRSRSRSRDRRYNRRRSRSRSRSRERSDRDRRDRGGERDRPEFKEAVKKLPMIGKMPLYKRPVINREKPDIETSKKASAEVSPATTLPPVGFLPKDVVAKTDSENISSFHENSMNSGYTYDAHSGYEHQERYMPSSAYGQASNEAPMEEEIPKDFQHGTESNEDVPTTADVKEDKGDTTPAALPDDFQQALDIIYAVNTGTTSISKTLPNQVPQPVPPPNSGPNSNGVSDDAPPGSTDYGDYSANGYGNYMGYQPYQQSFDGYAPVGYEELDDGPPGVGGDENSSIGTTRPPVTAVPAPVTDASHSEKASEKDPPPPGDDDMEDLRMLGIDVDDTAVVKH